jgi:very-short-patch-repair endonuclease
MESEGAMGWNDHMIDDEDNGVTTELSVWAYRHGWVGVDEAPSGDGRVSVSAPTIANTLRRELLGFHDAVNAVAPLVRNVTPQESAVGWEDIETVIYEAAFYVDPASRWVADPANIIPMAERPEIESLFPTLIPYLRLGGASLCESPAEVAFARAFAAGSLPYDLIAQYPFGRYRVDFYSPERRMVVEIDGAAYHSSPTQRAADGMRQREITGLGIRFVRIPAAEVLKNADQSTSVLYRAEQRRRNAELVLMKK